MTLQKSFSFIWLPSLHTDSSDTVEYSVDKQGVSEWLVPQGSGCWDEPWGSGEVTGEKDGVTHPPHSVTL